MFYLKVYLINSSYLIETDGSPCRPRSLEAEPRGADAESGMHYANTLLQCLKKQVELAKLYSWFE